MFSLRCLFGHDWRYQEVGYRTVSVFFMPLISWNIQTGKRTCLTCGKINNLERNSSSENWRKV